MLKKSNYYTQKNPYLTNSKITCFLKDKPTFKARYIDYTEEQQETPSLRIGRAVDSIVVHSMSYFRSKYRIKVLKKDNPVKYERQKFQDDKIILTKIEYDKIKKMANNLLEKQVVQDIKKTYKKNRILKQSRTDLGRWKGLAGIPDWYKVEGDKAYIVDLKTTSVIGDKFAYHMTDYGYYQQLAMYSYLIRVKHPEVMRFDFRIIAVENTSPFRVEQFYIEPRLIKQEREELISNTIYQVANETNFKHPDIGWEDYTYIGGYKEI